MKKNADIITRSSQSIVFESKNVDCSNETELHSQFYTRMKQATKGAIGLPLAVQVVGRRFEEETVLRVMKDVEALAGYESK